jgi:polyisoprenoid-binding protein YceI
MMRWNLVAALALLGAAPSVSAPQRLVLAPSGNEARYRVREQLANVSFPSDAVGTTQGVTGAIVIGDDGKIVTAQSRIVVDLTTLKSDRERRDRFIQGRTLETDRYPTATLVPTAARGWPAPPPRSGAFSFELVGDLTIHGVSRPTTWQVTAQATDSGFVGTASTRFTFGDFGLTPPRVMVVLSVEDDIRLEYDFHLVPAP